MDCGVLCRSTTNLGNTDYRLVSHGKWLWLLALGERGRETEEEVRCAMKCNDGPICNEEEGGDESRGWAWSCW